MTSAYQQLKEELIVIGTIGKANSLLQWDQEVMMPPESATERAHISATLDTVAHEKATSDKIGDLIKAAEDEISDPWDQRNLMLIKEKYALAKAMPSELVYAITEVQNNSVRAWQEAKPTSDWKKVTPFFQATLDLIREQAVIYGEVMQRSSYDAMMAQYARGNSQKLVDPIFASLKEKIPPLMHDIMKRQKPVGNIFTLPIEVQEKICRDIAQKVGFSFDRGRLDRSAHPFCGGTKYDIRMTTRYVEDKPFSGIYGVMHETGHALYTQNLPSAWDYMPVGADSDMSIHESQSLITENQAGYGAGFLRYLYNEIIKVEPGFATQGSVEEFQASVRQVRPSYIRVEADEVTYPLHVILRYEIEKELFNNNLDVADIPQLWNVKMKDMIGIEVPEHRLGCMQDIHWFWGLYGYFPTYSQGALYAAQLFAAMKRDVPDVETQLAQGEFKNFRAWLTKNIHQWGQFYDAPDLIKNATGDMPSADAWLAHIRARYLS